MEKSSLLQLSDFSDSIDDDTIYWNMEHWGKIKYGMLGEEWVLTRGGEDDYFSLEHFTF